MKTIRTAGIEELPIVQSIATVTYGPSYTAILGQEQVDYMLKKIYSLKALSAQFDQGHVFLMLQINQDDIGFASYSLTDAVEKNYHLQKLYLLPEMQGKGLGNDLLHEVISQVKQQGGKSLQLNVNRFNKAKGFYEKRGFTIKESVDIPIGEGFFMNDYVMELKIPYNR